MVRYQHIPPRLYDKAWNHIRQMLEIEANRPSYSPWVSPIVLIRKKDGQMKFCVYLRKLNEGKIKDAYSIPHIQDTLDVLTVWLTSLDLKSRY